MHVVNGIGTTEYLDDPALRVEAEREECEWLLTSGVLGRSGNLSRVLRYVCEEHFQGRADHIKEYTIAVEALGRRPAFDPQTDTIVRVTVHALRKRLLEIYQHEGASRPVRLVLPPGHYAPSFIHHPPPHPQAPPLTIEASAAAATPPSPAPEIIPSEPAVQPPSRLSLPNFLIWYLIAFTLAAIALGIWLERRAARRLHSTESIVISSDLPLPPPQATIHALMGLHRASYTDHSGATWATGNYCQSGTSVTLPPQRIEGTEDAPLYLGGVRGIAHCAFPVPPGLYELHFHFAETSDLPAATRIAGIDINAASLVNVDVVDDAGGHNIATTTIVTGVAPENDGTIHIDYVSEVSPLNAVEILPAPSARQLPIRIIASSNAFIDDQNQSWASDRYFNGGRHGQLSRVPNLASLGLFQDDRIGRFRYNIPAVAHARYRVKLYFRDPWFGLENGGIGGPGSRIFDVACNGISLLKDFDILAEGGGKPIVKTFDNVQASARGRIELSFIPEVNYPVVNAIEVLPED